MKGWIKLSRKIQDNFLWTDKEAFDKRSAWIDLLLLANHNDHQFYHRGKVITVKKGQVNRSILQLADRWRWSRGKVLRFLKVLEKSKMCSVNSTTDGTTITIENYAKYQDRQTTNNASDGTTDGQLTDIYKNYKNDKERDDDGIWLSDYLTDNDWDKLRNMYVSLAQLIDIVDNRVNRPWEVENPFQYFVSSADKMNWPKSNY